MNELQLLDTLLGRHQPSADAVDRGRRRLVNRMSRGPVRRARTGWLVAGLGITAAAAAAVVVVASSSVAPTQGGPTLGSSAPPNPPVATAASGRQVLLAAATVAQRSPEGTGTYWHLTVSETEGTNGPVEVSEYWITAAGQWWFRGVKTGGTIQKMPTTRPEPFSLVGVDLTLDQLRGLPTDPTALKTWIAGASTGPLATFQSLISLVSTLPAPPAVRAAAFRALAAYPDVSSLGAVPGGQGLMLPSGERLVVDPATGRVDQTSVYVTPDGAVYHVGQPNTAKIQAEWTNTLPG